MTEPVFTLTLSDGTRAVYDEDGKRIEEDQKDE